MAAMDDRVELQARADSELAAVWSRFNALVVAVSIFFAMINVSPSSDKAIVAAAGFVICALWLTFHATGYCIFTKKAKDANHPGPFFDPICICSRLVIAVFAGLFLWPALAS